MGTDDDKPKKTDRIARALAEDYGYRNERGEFQLPLTPHRGRSTPFAAVPIIVRLLFPILPSSQLTLLFWCWLRAGKYRVFWTSEASALLELGRSKIGAKDLRRSLKQLADLQLIAFRLTATGELQIAALDPRAALKSGLTEKSPAYAALRTNVDLAAHVADVLDQLGYDSLASALEREESFSSNASSARGDDDV